MDKDKEIMNTVYQKSLEFGENYRRPIMDIINESYPELSDTDKKRLERYITEVRTDIEQYFSDRSEQHHAFFDDWVSFKGKVWIHKNYPWMNAENINHAISQAIYFTRF